ncbi:TonB-dependent receptor plug domain-containing protein [Maricaulis parjimensis]|uniref:TonB-dependent receptor plug domain-containing protein n=1 Tax=Maricaulis parjimensis TaxID=144023 RepID=UPI001939A687|nr:TonB-dependent receptor [Maricaulis parjimensis]
MKNILLTTSVSALAAGLVATAGASAQQLDYAMMSELFGEPVTAGATGAPQRASDVPATMIIITQDDIERAPEFDIPGILRHYAGIDFTRYSFGDSQVSIRGAAAGYSPRLLVLVNGREVYLDSYGYTAWSTLPVQLEEIQQIEVVKGAQSALYGFNAVAGVVNIITRNPQTENYGNFRANVGSNGYADVALTYGRSFGDRAAVRISYGNAAADEFTALNTGAASLSTGDFTRETAAVQGSFQLTENVSLTAEATHSEVGQQEMTSIYLPASTVYELTSYRGVVEADTSFGFVTATAYRNETEIAYSFGPLTSDLTVVQLEDLFKIGTDDTIRLSVEFRDGNSISFPNPGNGDFGYTTWSASAMWNHKFSSALDLTLAGRFDNLEWEREGSPNPIFYPFSQADYSVSYEEFSYNAALTWRPEFGGTVRFMTGRGIQAPSMFDIGFTLNGTIGTVPFAISGNPDMETSVVTNYEIAYDRNFASGLQLRSAVFFEQNDDIKGAFGLAPDMFNPLSGVPVFLYDNRGDTETLGAEVSLSGSFGEAWSWDANYTFQAVHDDIVGFPTGTVRDFEATTPMHLANLHLGWTGGRLTIDGYLNYVSDVMMPSQPTFGSLTVEPVNAYVAGSLRANFELRENLVLSATAQNITFGAGEATSTHFETAGRYWLGLRASF